MNRNPAKCNLPPHHLAALKELIQLQKNRNIIIKKCDKVAGIIILNFDDYMEACKKHFDSKQILEGGEEKPFYTEVGPESLENTKSKIKLILQEALHNQIISKEKVRL